MNVTETNNFQSVTQHKSESFLLERKRLIKLIESLSWCMHIFSQMLNTLPLLQVVYKTG